MKNLFYCIPIVFLFCKCSYNNTLERKIKDNLSSWKIKSEVVVETNENTLNVHIFVKGEDGDFFMDVKSNEMIIKMLSYILFEDIRDYNDFNYIIKFNRYDEVIEINTDINGINENKKYFDTSGKMYEFVQYSLSNMKYIDVLIATQLIKKINESDNEIFTYQGDYWDLLYDYSKACESPGLNQKNIYHFVLFAGFASHPDQSFLDRKLFVYYLNSCGLDTQLLDMNALDILKYIHSR